MKTLDYVLENYKSQVFDGRDLNRLLNFIPYEKMPAFGMELKDEVTKEEWDKNFKTFTRDNILAQLKEDVEFGFEKALDQRGISASCMAGVVKMWNWILEEGLEDFEEYAQYGLPIFKATAVKYGFENPIGDDDGDEPQYAG